MNRLDTYNPGTASRFIYDGDEVAAVIDSTGAIERRYVRGDDGDELIFQLVGSIDRWYYGDERGSVVTQTDDAGNAQITNRRDTPLTPLTPCVSRPLPSKGRGIRRKGEAAVTGVNPVTSVGFSYADPPSASRQLYARLSARLRLGVAALGAS